VASFKIKGLNGKKKLEGVLPVRGAKNAVLKALAASILFKQGVSIKNVPVIADVLKMQALLEDIGIEIKKDGRRSLFLKPKKNLKKRLDKKKAEMLRSSVVLTGPLLASEGEVYFPHPGGCVIGTRPIDVFLDSFKKMGAKVKINDRDYRIKADRLKGADVFFKLPSVTATETIMMTAVFADGTTRLKNVACEPEIESLARFLNKAGADIKGAGTHTIVIKGPRVLKREIFVTPPDRIEAGSLAIIAALCGKNIRITGCDPCHMDAILNAFDRIGVDLLKTNKSLLINSKRVKPRLKPLDIKTREYPGFPTDLQAPMAVLLTQCHGRSKIFETVFEGRLNYLNDLSRMGAEVVLCDPHRAIVDGVSDLRGREVESPDLRAGLAFLIASMVAKGDSIINNIGYIDRGYENIEDRLNQVGAEIKRIN